MQPTLPGGSIGRELQKTLFPQEQVLCFAQGKANQTLVATNQRVIILKGGIGSGGMFFGTTATSYGYGQVTSVELRKTFVDGFVETSTGGMQNVQRGRTGQMNAQNTVPFNGWDNDRFQQVVNVIRQQITLLHISPAAQVQPQAAPVTPPTIPQQIQQLAQLRDQGVLTEDEFTVKKAEMLARM